MTDAQELKACEDCLLFVANGDEPEDRDLLADIEDNLGDDISRLVCGDLDWYDEFSWSPCQCCGSRLGGTRHKLVILGE